jgi:hypothetical protein
MNEIIAIIEYWTDDKDQTKIQWHVFEHKNDAIRFFDAHKNDPDVKLRFNWIHGNWHFHPHLPSPPHP